MRKLLIILGILLIPSLVFAGTFGNTNSSASSTTVLAQKTYGRIFTLLEDATLTKFFVRLKNDTSGDIEVSPVLYEVENGYPTNIVIQLRSKIISNSNFQWIQFSFPASIDITQGDYFLAIHPFDSDSNKRVWISLDNVTDDDKSYIAIDATLRADDPYPSGAIEWKTTPFSMVNPNMYIEYN